VDRPRYDSAMFWLAFGTAASVIGLALMTIGVARLPANASPLGSGWFDGGLGLLAIGVGLLLWALWLFLGRRRGVAQPSAPAETTPAPPRGRASDWMGEAVRGYYRERDRMFRTWQKEQKEKKKRS
jgi:hypothetical protein